MENNENKVVLLIDDEKPVRESFKNYLEDYEFDILEASSGDRGLKIIKNNKIDLILLDLRMPGIDGFSVLESLQDLIKTLPVIVVSGTGVVNDTVRALHLGAWDFILKPIEDMDVLMHTISLSLERAELIKKNKEYQKSLEENNETLSNTIAGLVESQKKVIQSEKMHVMTNLLKELADEITDPISVGVIASSHLVSKTEELERVIHESLDKDVLLKYVDKQKTLNEMIWRNIKQSAEVLGRFKNVVEIGTAESETTFNLKETINGVFSIFKRELESRDIKISINCMDSLEIISQHNVFYQIFYNLIQNVIVHAFSDHEEKLLEISAEETNEKLVIKFADNGIGIKADILKRIYDPFFTINKSSKNLGFGLTIVYNLVNITLKGSIEAISQENEGLKYIISIPLYDDSSEIFT